jgi:hypothetical protein
MMGETKTEQTNCVVAHNSGVEVRYSGSLLCRTTRPLRFTRQAGAADAWRLTASGNCARLELAPSLPQNQ